MKDRSNTAHTSLEERLGLMNAHFIHVEQSKIDFKSVGHFKATLNGQDINGGGTFVVDLEQVEYMGEAGFNALLDLHHRLQKKGGEVILLDIKPDSQVSDSLEMKGFSEIFRQEQSIN